MARNRASDFIIIRGSHHFIGLSTTLWLANEGWFLSSLMARKLDVGFRYFLARIFILDFITHLARKIALVSINYFGSQEILGFHAFFGSHKTVGFQCCNGSRG